MSTSKRITAALLAFLACSCGCVGGRYCDPCSSANPLPFRVFEPAGPAPPAVRFHPVPTRPVFEPRESF